MQKREQTAGTQNGMIARMADLAIGTGWATHRLYGVRHAPHVVARVGRGCGRGWAEVYRRYTVKRAAEMLSLLLMQSPWEAVRGIKDVTWWWIVSLQERADCEE
jgi:hypothetical protein